MLRCISLIAVASIVLAGCAGRPLNVSEVEPFDNPAYAIPFEGPAYEPNPRREAFMEQDANVYIPKILESIRTGDTAMVSRFLDPCLEIGSVDGALENRCQFYLSRLNWLDEAFIENVFQWLQQEPKSYLAHLIAAGVVNAEAWAIRGNGYANQTHPRHMREFKHRLQQANNLLEEARLLRPRLPYAYANLIASYGAMGAEQDVAVKYLVSRAKQHVPWSLSVAENRLFAEEPRWGGSYSAMSEIVDEYRHYMAIDREFRRLPALVERERALDLRDGFGVEQGMNAAEQILLSIRDEQEQLPSWLYIDLASLYKKKGNGGEASKYYEKAKERDPHGLSIRKNWICLCPGITYREALENARIYIERQPNSYYSWASLGSLQSMPLIGDKAAALESFEKAQSLRPHDPGIRLAIQKMRDKLDLPDLDLFDEAYQKDLIVYSSPVYDVLEHVKQAIREAVASDFTRQKNQTFELMLNDYFTLPRFSHHYRNHLNSLDWSEQQWKEVATLYADAANIARHVSSSNIEQYREKYAQKGANPVIEEVSRIQKEVANWMAGQFLEQLNKEPALENIGA